MCISYKSESSIQCFKETTNNLIQKLARKRISSLLFKCWHPLFKQTYLDFLTLILYLLIYLSYFPFCCLSMLVLIISSIFTIQIVNTLLYLICLNSPSDFSIIHIYFISRNSTFYYFFNYWKSPTYLLLF